MERLREVDFVLKDLLDSRDLSLHSNDRLDEVATHCLRLLNSLRVFSSPPPTPCPSPKSSVIEEERSNSLLNLYSQPTCSSFSTKNEAEQLDFSAHQAFDKEIYARCVKIVDEAAKKGYLNMDLISLAHNSYQMMVDQAETTSDALKFAHFWIEFLDRNSPQSDLVGLRFLLEALAKRYEIDEKNQIELGIRILSTLLELMKKSGNADLVISPSNERELLRKWLKTLEPILKGNIMWMEAEFQLGIWEQETQIKISSDQELEEDQIITHL